MGAWGIQSFANDDAMDWLPILESSDDFTAVHDALDAVADSGGDYLEAPECSVALAAAEVVAAMRGRASPDLPAKVMAWVEARGGQMDPALVDLGRRAVDAVRGRSELSELWDEADPEDRDAWRAVVADLRARLS